MMAAIQVINDEGKVVTSLALGTLIETPAKNPTVPESVLWYREATKWLATAASAAIVFGYGFITSRPAPKADRVAFTIISAVLLIAVLGGIVCHLWLLKYANSVENLNNGVAADAERLTKDKEDAKEMIRWWYKVLMWPFFIGMVGFTGFCALRIWFPSEPEAGGQYTAVTFTDGTLALVDSKRPAVWILRKANGKYRWEKVKPDLTDTSASEIKPLSVAPHFPAYYPDAARWGFIGN